MKPSLSLIGLVLVWCCGNETEMAEISLELATEEELCEPAWEGGGLQDRKWGLTRHQLCNALTLSCEKWISFVFSQQSCGILLKWSEWTYLCLEIQVVEGKWKVNGTHREEQGLMEQVPEVTEPGVQMTLLEQTQHPESSRKRLWSLMNLLTFGMFNILQTCQSFTLSPLSQRTNEASTCA